MRKPSHIPIALAVCMVLFLGAYQGIRVDRLIGAEAFYRWILSATGQSVLKQNLSEIYIGDEKVQMMDQELFDALIETAETWLPDIPIREGDEDKDGVLSPKLVRAVNHNDQNDLIWAFATSSDAAELRRDFLTYKRENRLASAGTQFSVSDIYGKDSANVSLGSMFFGFQKMAANLVWLEVDKYWHQGMVHRMVPLMYLTVTLDPNFIDAYLLGSWHLAYNESAKLEDTPPDSLVWSERYQAMIGPKERLYYQAIDFLKDGTRKNPLNYKLYFDLGFGIYKQKLADYPNAVKYLERATRVWHDRWVERQLYLCYRLNGQYEEALAGYENYIERFPNFKPGPRLALYCAASLKERDSGLAGARARELEELAEAATDDTIRQERLTEAQAARQEEKALEEEARALWNEVLEPGVKDSLAEGHLLVLDAMELRAQGRHSEAIPMLMQARQATEMWERCNDLIIELKQEAGIQLSYSEQMQLMRQQDLEERRQQSQQARAN